MAKKTRRSQHKRQQRALQKRTKRKQRLARRATPESTTESPRQILRRARTMPLLGAWVQNGWQDLGSARVVLTRTQSSETVVFAEYVVDYLCTGIRDTLHVANYPQETFNTEGLARVYGGTPPVSTSVELAHEIVWGAFEYAKGLGLRQHTRFNDTQRILEPADSLPRSGNIEFGYRGQPVYRPEAGDNQVAIVKRLIDAVGLGNFFYVPRDGIPDEVADLLEIGEDEQQQTGLWTPEGEQTSGGVDSDSGLWVPGGGGNAPQTTDQPSETGIWTPGRS